MPFARLVICVLLFSLYISQAMASEDFTERVTLLGPLQGVESSVEIHGFMSQGFIQSFGNNYLPNSKQGTMEFADAGLTFNKQLGNRLRAGAQLFARDFGRTGNYDAKFDWFLLDFHWRDWLGIRAGRIKIPYALYNETNDIDAARVPVLLPQSVYPTDQRDYLLAQTGFDLYGFVSMGGAGALDYRLYRGTLKIDLGPTVGAPVEAANADVPYVHGGRLVWDTPLKGLRIGGTYQSLKLSTDLYIPSLSKTVATDLKVTMGVGSLEYTARDFQIAAEYAKWWGEVDSNSAAIIAPTKVAHERYYGMANFRLTEWLHPGFYHSVIYPNDELRENRNDFSRDTAVFCRMDLTSNWLFKLEWHFIDGTAGLASSINGNKTAANMDERWQMFLAKTTVFF